MPPWLELTFTLIEKACIPAAALMALVGLTTWRSEMLGRRRAELAEEVLACFYEAKDVIGWVRFPGSHGGEGMTRTPVHGESEEQAQARKDWYVPVERLTKNSELFSKIQSLKYRFIAYFGPDAEKPFKSMKDIHSKIMVAATMLIKTQPRREDAPMPASTQKLRDRCEAEIGWFLDEDPLKPVIEQAIVDIESICKHYLMDRKR